MYGDSKSKKAMIAVPASKDSKAFLKKRTGPDATQATVGPPKSPDELQAELKDWLTIKAPFHSDAQPNAFGLAVGRTASADLKNFISVFEPLAAETPAGEALRAEGFKAADPNGKAKLRVHSGGGGSWRGSGCG
jgi:hypothetical protein